MPAPGMFLRRSHLEPPERKYESPIYQAEKQTGSKRGRQNAALTVQSQSVDVERIDRSNKRNLLQIVILQCFPPTTQDEKSLLKVVHSLATKYRYPTKVVSVWLASQDCFRQGWSHIGVIDELERLLQSIVESKRFGGLRKMKNLSSRLVIIADEITSWIVKDIMARAEDLPRKTLGLMFLEYQLYPSRDHETATWAAARQLPGLEAGPLMQISRCFDKKFFNDNPKSLLEPITWILKSLNHVDVDTDLLNSEPRNLCEVLDVCFRRASEIEERVDSGRGDLVSCRKNFPISQRSSGLQMYRDRLQQSPPTSGPPSIAKTNLRVDKCQSSPTAPERGSGPSSQSLDRFLMHLLGGNTFKCRDPLILTDAELSSGLKTASVGKRVAYGDLVSLFHHGEYSSMLERAESLGPSGYNTGQNHNALSGRETQRQFELQSIGIFRLKVLSIASLGFPEDLDKTFEKEIEAAESLNNQLATLFLLNNKQHPEDDITEAQIVAVLLSVTKAEVLVKRGNYQAALLLVEESLQTSIQFLGEKSILTLDTAILLSWLQIATSCVAQGRVLIRETLCLISKTLGSQNQLSMKATSVLIFASQMEGRYTQALNGSTDLLSVLDRATTPCRNDVMALNYRQQLGALHIRQGNYATAERLLQPAYSFSLKRLGEEHPVTARILSNLAFAQYEIGKMARARVNLSLALRFQLQVYLRIPKDDLWRSETQASSYLTDSILPKVSHAFKFENEQPSMTSTTDLGPSFTRPMTHPDILWSLLAYAKLEAATEEFDLGLVADILHLVWFESNRKSGSFNELTLEAAMSLGNFLISWSKVEVIQSYSTQGTPHQKYMHKFYEFIMSQGVASMTAVDCDVGNDAVHHSQPATEGPDSKTICATRSHLSTNHPLFLRARFEVIKTRFLHAEEGMSPSCLTDCIIDLRSILSVQQDRPGWNHPDSLSTMLTLLALQVASGDGSEEIKRTKDELVYRLQRQDIRDERLLQCLLLEECVANLIMAEMEHAEYGAIEIYTNIIQGAGGAEFERNEDPQLLRAFQELKARAIEARGNVPPKEHEDLRISKL